jgi:cytochrome b6-f complex iron-sulfur subunit
MNGTVILVAVVVLVLALAALVASAMKRRDLGMAIGDLSKETKKRDKATVAPSTTEAVPTGKEIERAAVLARTGKDVVAAPAKAPAPFVAPDADAIGVSRRQFLNRSLVGGMVLSLSAFGGACIAFLWPKVGGGFGSKIRVGRVSDLLQEISKSQGFLYRADGRMWLTPYPLGAIEKAKKVYSSGELAGMEAGIIALYQKCPHLGCRVPDCKTSQWFECPCHGSQYNHVGEKRGGPAPRGMDRFKMEVTSDGFLLVDTGAVIPGPPIGVNTTGQEAEGPHCLSGGGEH